MTIQNDYHEVMDLMDSMLLFIFKGLQERKQYRGLIDTVKKYYPDAKDFRLGLDDQGKIPRITFAEAKRMLRDELRLKTDNDQDLRCETKPSTKG